MPPRTLQLPAETDFHRRAWRVQRISYLVLTVIVLAALLGAFGGGPLSRASRNDGHGLTLQYERFARASGRTTVDLYFDAAAETRTHALLLDRGWIEAVRIQSIVPAPSQTLALPGALRYRFDVQEGSDLHVRIEAEPAAPGPLALGVGQPDVAPIRVTQLAFP
jgi:hypothetical protein